MSKAYDDYGNVVNLVEHDKKVYNKAIDDFEYMCVQMIKKEQDTRYGYLNGMDIREIAKQLKRGTEE